MNSDFIKYSEAYARYWFRYRGYDIQDTERGRLLTKGQFHNLFPELCEQHLAAGEPLPDRFRLVARPPFVPFVEQHGKRKEKSIF